MTRLAGACPLDGRVRITWLLAVEGEDACDYGSEKATTKEGT